MQNAASLTSRALPTPKNYLVGLLIQKVNLACEQWFKMVFSFKEA